MRSLIILEVEHGEDTDALEHFIGVVRNVPVLMSPGVVINDYTVRVDLPACFVLDSVSTPVEPEHKAGCRSTWYRTPTETRLNCDCKD